MLYAQFKQEPRGSATLELHKHWGLEMQVVSESDERTAWHGDLHCERGAGW